MSEKRSPFSLSHDWSVHWTLLPSNSKVNNHIDIQSEKERKALEAIAAIGLIGGKQLSKLFSLDKQRIKRMTRQKRIIRHEIRKNKQLIPLFTLGPAVSADIIPHYVINYWKKYSIEDILKRLLFFQLYSLFPESARIIPCASPFIGTIFFKEQPYYVYVVRGNMEDLLTFLKWNEFQERMLFITEEIEHLKLLDLFLFEGPLKVRVVTDHNLKKEIDEAFYRYERNEETGRIDWQPEKTVQKV